MNVDELPEGDLTLHEICRGLPTDNFVQYMFCVLVSSVFCRGCSLKVKFQLSSAA